MLERFRNARRQLDKAVTSVGSTAAQERVQPPVNCQLAPRGL